MSRSNTALAYDAPPATGARTEYGKPRDYRLLGEPRFGRRTTGVAFQDRSEVYYVPALAVIDPEEEQYVGSYYPAPAGDVRERRLRVHHPAWLLGAAVAVLALVALVSPVFAGGQGAGKRTGLLFGGSGMASNGTAEGGGQAVVIDTTTQPPAAAPPEQAQQSQPSSGVYDVAAPPSTSVRRIESVLQQYGSPAAGLGQALYDLGVRYGIDPAYALAFFVHESGCGTQGVARFTRSLGNIRWTEGYEDYEGYREYNSWEAGMEDWYKLISDLYIGGWGLRTVDAIIPVYAPWGDNNNPPAYIASVKSMVDSWRGK